MGTKAFLVVTALVEAGAAIALLIIPSWTARLLLSEDLTSPQAIVVARIAGAALTALAIACWIGKSGEPHLQSALVVGMLAYNIGVPIVFIQGWIASGLGGPLLWPACVLHMLLGGWCTACYVKPLLSRRWPS